MDDRTLLEKAAKAAGLDGDVEITEMGGIPVGIWRKGSKHPDATRCFWGPLRDDGDALRLAVNLRFDLSMDEFHAEVGKTSNEDPFGISLASEEATMGYGIEEATRRAIVRAAASLGDKHE